MAHESELCQKAFFCQKAWSLILEKTIGVAHYTEENRSGRWSESADFCYLDAPVRELCGCTLGILGNTDACSELIRVAQAFGLKVLCQHGCNGPILHGCNDPVQQNCNDRSQLISCSDVLLLVPGSEPLSGQERSLIKTDAIIIDAL